MFVFAIAAGGQNPRFVCANWRLENSRSLRKPAGQRLLGTIPGQPEKMRETGLRVARIWPGRDSVEVGAPKILGF